MEDVFVGLCQSAKRQRRVGWGQRMRRARAAMRDRNGYVDVEGVDGKLIGREIERFEHLLKGEVATVSVDDHVIGALAKLPLDELEQMLQISFKKKVNLSLATPIGMGTL
jgi:uncharacterized coiled-coil DUF342 family protein